VLVPKFPDRANYGLTAVAAVHLRCVACLDTGHVCENHPHLPWEHPEGCGCGAGMPCPACCSPIPEDGAQLVGLAFVPDWQR
jgi:hypothetical protein